MSKKTASEGPCEKSEKIGQRSNLCVEIGNSDLDLFCLNDF